MSGKTYYYDGNKRIKKMYLTIGNGVEKPIKKAYLYPGKKVVFSSGFAVTYHMPNGSTQVVEVEEGQNAISVAPKVTPTTRYVFKGWSLTKNGGVISSYTPVADTDLYAIEKLNVMDIWDGWGSAYSKYDDEGSYNDGTTFYLSGHTYVLRGYSYYTNGEEGNMFNRYMYRGGIDFANAYTLRINCSCSAYPSYAGPMKVLIDGGQVYSGYGGQISINVRGYAAGTKHTVTIYAPDAETIIQQKALGTVNVTDIYLE